VLRIAEERKMRRVQIKKQRRMCQRNLERVTCKNLIWHIIIITIIMFIILLYNIPKVIIEKEDTSKVSESYSNKTTTLYVSNLVTFKPQQIEEELSKEKESSKVEVDEIDYYPEFTYSKDWPVFEEFEATAYCACPKCCGKWADGITVSGTKATAKRTIAVDSNLIPLGSKVEIERLGTYIAEDTGSAIKGKIIDIYFDTHEEALKFGRQKVNIRVISSQNGGN
jgi:3D (Asp-Asp-Asp) domain-containing protein